MAVDASQVGTETRDFLFGYVKDVPDQQLKAADAVDTKLVQVLAVATVVVGLLSLADPNIVSAIGVVISYLIVLAGFGLGYLSRHFQTMRYPDVLWNRYWMDSPEAIKLELVAKVAQVYPANKTLLDNKHYFLTWSLIGLGLEAIFVLAALVASAI